MHSIIFAVSQEDLIPEEKLSHATRNPFEENLVTSNHFEDPLPPFADYVDDIVHTPSELGNEVSYLRNFLGRFGFPCAVVTDEFGFPVLTITVGMLKAYLRSQFAQYEAHKDMSFEEFAGLCPSDKPFEVEQILNDNYSYHIYEGGYSDLQSFDSWARDELARLIEAKKDSVGVTVVGAVDYHY